MPWSKPAQPETKTPGAESGDTHLDQARESLRALLDDAHLPPKVRASLSEEFQQVATMLDKLEHGHIHIAVFGSVGVGKSALLNALLGSQRFSTSPLHGETRDAQMASWQAYDDGGVFLVDTPGINEVDGEARERLAHEVAGRSDLLLFVVDGDLSETELSALRLLVRQGRPVLLVFNKTDRYTAADRKLVLQALQERTAGLLPAANIVTASANPSERVYIQVDEQGRETETTRKPAPEVQALREKLWMVLESEGAMLAAVNATLFAGKLSDSLSKRVVAVKKDLADRVVRNYCLAKGIAVGLNPIPIADLLTAAAVDVGLVVHLSRIYGLPISRHEAGDLIRTIGAQMVLVMGSVWAIHLISSALKGGSLGLSTLLTAGAQGAVAYYATYIVGQSAHRYFEQGKSWGKQGPKRLVQEILDSVDRDSLLAQAKADILVRLRSG